MADKKIYNLFKGERTALKAILEYFSLKNKVLWEGSLGNGSVTVEDISKYKTLQITVNGTHCIASVKDGHILAVAFEKNQWGMYSKHFTGTISGDKLAVVECYYMAHVPSQNHGAAVATTISKIIGIDPILPDALKNIIGGGCAKLGGGAVATVSALKGYYLGGKIRSICKAKQGMGKAWRDDGDAHVRSRWILGNKYSSVIRRRESQSNCSCDNAIRIICNIYARALQRRNLRASVYDKRTRKQATHRLHSNFNGVRPLTDWGCAI